MAQPVHVQQLLKLKQQAVQQQKAIQPQAAPGPAAVQQKVPGSCGGLSRRPVLTLGTDCTDSRSAPRAWQPHTQKALCSEVSGWEL